MTDQPIRIEFAECGRSASVMVGDFDLTKAVGVLAISVRLAMDETAKVMIELDPVMLSLAIDGQITFPDDTATALRKILATTDDEEQRP